ncbi:unnamed protein product [Notodromas monacha]|uniref:Uncharacterized protein n=1 Tax=Notodromas monacha TaxID=399045 RepID=A0A7R9GKZ0_9CRUS|nr:unnamed protein product [Notodromas monacha]CAG0925318.1 unnamed protein product [Notodromas monacha]
MGVGGFCLGQDTKGIEIWVEEFGEEFQGMHEGCSYSLDWAPGRALACRAVVRFRTTGIRSATRRLF